MKKLVILLFAAVVLSVPCLADTMGSINDAVDKKMKDINSSGKTGPFVNEIKINKNAKTETAPAEESPKSGYIATLSALNIVGGIFEGGVVGTGCGLIGYSQSFNRDTKPLINGAIIGTASGATLAAVLSFVQLGTSRQSSSDDLGFDIIGGTLMGGLLGSAGGVISWGKTTDMENISEGTGYGIAIGSICGLIMGIVESLLPEGLRGGQTIQGGSHAYIQQLDGTTIVSCNIQY
jgi:ABC-type Fe3+-siderophore transport system permease subunit